MLEKVIQIFKVKDLRRKIIFVLALLIVFRIAAHIPVPGVDQENLRRFLSTNQIFGLLDIFSGGGLSNLSIVMLGVSPYITASIIMQLLAMIIPRLEELSKEGEQGRQKINQWTRYLTIPLAIVQSYGFLSLFMKSSNQPIITNISPFDFMSMIVSVTAGTMFLMWLGELITEKGIGNGVSLIIFAGIVSRIPQVILQLFVLWDWTKIPTYIGFLALAFIVITGVVIVTEGRRNIPIVFAKRVRGMKMYGGTSTYLPLRVNQAGVIPIIFAISIVLFPGMIANFFVNSPNQILAAIARQIAGLFQDNLFYGVFYFILVVIFTYFYTAVIFHPKTIAENVQKQGGFIPGIRPGRRTAKFLGQIMNRITLAGALFLGAIAILPFIMQSVTGIAALSIGGTGLLIVVSVVLETMKQIESQLVMRDYEGF